MSTSHYILRARSPNMNFVL